MATVIPIQNDTDYESALGRIYDLMAAELDSPEGCELDALVTAVEEYESRTVDIGTPGLIAAIEFRMEQAGLGPSDLESCVGSREDVSAVAFRKTSDYAINSQCTARTVGDSVRIKFE